jgi:hypothetical protein
MVDLGEKALTLLAVIVKAFDDSDDRGRREPLFLFRAMQADVLQHRALPPDFDRDLDVTVIEDLRYGGLIDVDEGRGTWRITPTPLGRQAARDLQAASETTLSAPARDFLEAVGQSAQADNPLAWPRLEAMLISLRQHWQAAGFPGDGVLMRPLIEAVPDEQRNAAVVALRALLHGGYVEASSDIELMPGVPAITSLTSRAFEALDGWPSDSPAQLYERLLAGIAAEAEATTDPERKRRLQKVGESLRELGVNTASEVLSKVILGG